MAQAQNAAPKITKVAISVIADPTTAQATGYETSINVRVIKGTCLMANGQVRVLCGSNQKASLVLDGNGEANYTHIEPLSKAGQSVSLTFRVEGELAEAMIKFDLPANEEKKGDDAEILDLFKYINPSTWVPTIFVRLLKSGGIGIPGHTVSLIFDGQRNLVQTNDQGEADFILPRALNEGEDTMVLGTATGIRDPAPLPLKRRRPMDPPPAQGSFAWWFCYNNVWAAYLWIFSIILLIYIGFAGFGNAIFNQTELSVQQKLFNASVEKVNPTKTIKLAENKVKFPELPFYLGLLDMLMLFVISPLFTIWAFHEELKEGVEIGIEKLMNKSSATASDPLVERLAVWSGALARTRKTGATKTASTDEEKPSAEKSSFLTIFKTEMAAEVLMSVLAGIYNSFVRKSGRQI